MERILRDVIRNRVLPFDRPAARSFAQIAAMREHPVTADELILQVRAALGVPRLREFNVYLGHPSAEKRAVQPDPKK